MTGLKARLLRGNDIRRLSERKYTASPFRYPGAKSRLLTPIMAAIAKRAKKCDIFVDPFVGGGSVALAVMEAYPKQFPVVVLNDLDRAVANFWRVIACRRCAEELAAWLAKTTPTIKLHKQCRKWLNYADTLYSAFACLVLNRTSFSGILMSGPIGGYKQKSKWKVGCRYNGGALAEKVLELSKRFGDRLLVSSVDFSSVILQFDLPRTLVYCDAPYYVKGNDLYRKGMSEVDHLRLAVQLHTARADWVCSYDDSLYVREKYKSFGKFQKISARYSIKGENRESWEKGHELLITRGA